MNIQKVRQLVTLYKKHFHSIHNEEIYKWQAVKYFQDNWAIEASDFFEMLSRSFAGAKNLLDSGLYYPKKMLLNNVRLNPEYFRELFRTLYDESKDLTQRVLHFQEGIKSHSKKVFPSLKNDYQDYRAILVYLCLKYPDRYFFYKYEMFRDFINIIEYPFRQKRGDFGNVINFLTLCNLVKQEILKDNELLELHQTRLKQGEYKDSSANILTQDVIYAAVHHIDKFETSGVLSSIGKRMIKVDPAILPVMSSTKLQGRFTNYIENEIENKRIGDLGELLVLEYEIEKLRISGIKKKPEHISKIRGDGLGYDILSYDEKGKEIFIEVKTTTSAYHTPFFITQNELVCSREEKNRFFLFRLFEFDDKNNQAKYFLRQGDLMPWCINPILYKAVFEW